MAYSYKGAITFGLVYIPITLSVSVKENDIGFNMIEKNTLTRIKYKKTCVDCNDKEVANQDIVKGYQYEKGKYVIFTEQDFDKLKTQKDKNISIIQFVDLNEVDPIYFDKSYYANSAGGDKAFSVFLEAMEKTNKAGIAKCVLGNKETLILIRANNGQMLVNTLYFANEIQKNKAQKIAKSSKQELDLAINLIDQMTKEFKPEIFKDEYNEKIKKAIKKKIAGGEIIAPKETAQPDNIINLMDALKQSLNKPKKAKTK